MAEPLEHIIRPQLPWRTEAAKTECGRLVDGVAGGAIGFDDFRQKLSKLGQQRTAMTTCMTCVNRASWGSRIREDWAHNPAAVMAREIGPSFNYEPPEPLTTELRAIAMLIAEHRTEFDELVAGLQGAISLDERRKRRS